MRRWALGAPAVAFGAVFFLWPMASIIGTGLAADPQRLWSVASDPSIRSIAWFTVWQAAASTVLTLVVGLPVAGVIARYEFPGKTALRTLVTIPFVLPTVVVALAFLTLLGPNGVLGVDLSGTAVAVIGAHVFFNLAVVVRTVGGLWNHIDPAMEQAAHTLGATRWRAFRTVTLPLLRPAILAAAAIVFLFSFTSFGVVLLLGAPRLATIEVEIYRSAALLLDVPTAASLALLQLIGVTTALLWYSRIQQRSAVALRLLPTTAVVHRPRGRERWMVAGIATLGATVTLVPLGAMLTRVLTPGARFGVDAFAALGRVDHTVVEPYAAMANSLRFGVAAVLIALAVAIPATVLIASSRTAGRWIDPLLMLPIGSSAVTLGFGFVVGLDAPIDLRSWWGLVPVAHALVAIPFVVRMTMPVLRSITPRLRQAAATLGASPRRVWRTVDLPIVTPAVAAAAALAFVVSLGEFGATLFVARPGGQTLTLAVYRLLGRPGDVNVQAAMAISLILIALTALAVASIERLRVPSVGGF